MKRIAGLAGFFRQSSYPKLETMVNLGGTLYPLNKAEQVYKKLTNPRIKTSPEAFYQSERAIGTIASDGEVRFYTQWDELANHPGADNGWSLQSPAELGVEQISDSPTNEVRQLFREFNEQLTSGGQLNRPRSALFYNIPISEKRASIYQNRLGFIDANTKGKPFQVRDNRRFAGNPTIAQLYILGDAGHLKRPVAAEVLRERLLQRHPYLRDIVEALLADGTPFGPPDIPLYPTDLSPSPPSLIERKRQLLKTFLRALGK